MDVELIGPSGLINWTIGHIDLVTGLIVQIQSKITGTNTGLPIS